MECGHPSPEQVRTVTRVLAVGRFSHRREWQPPAEERESLHAQLTVFSWFRVDCYLAVAHTHAQSSKPQVPRSTGQHRPANARQPCSSEL
jgi:hypothetical protein